MKTPKNPPKPYPSDVSDEEWSFVAPYLTLCREDSPQRNYPLRDAFNALRWVVRSGSPWRMMPHDFPPWYAVQQQTQLAARRLFRSHGQRSAGAAAYLQRVTAGAKHDRVP